MKISTTGYIKENKVKFRNLERFTKEILESGWNEFEITVEKKRKKRSENQSRYYWGVVVFLITERFIELGNDVSKEEVHDYLKHEFNYTEFVNEKTGDIIRIPKSTANLTTSEMMNYISKIQIFAADILGIVIPDPSSQTEFSY